MNITSSLKFRQPNMLNGNSFNNYLYPLHERYLEIKCKILNREYEANYWICLRDGRFNLQKLFMGYSGYLLETTSPDFCISLTQSLKILAITTSSSFTVTTGRLPS